MSAAQKTLALLRKVGSIWKNTSSFDQHIKDVKYISADDGRIVGEIKLEERHLNHHRGMHGGFIAFLVDVVTGVAQWTHEKNPTGGVSVDLHVRYLKAAQIGDDILIEANIVKQGQNLAFMECVFRNKKDNSIIAMGKQTKYVGEPFRTNEKPMKEVLEGFKASLD